MIRAIAAIDDKRGIAAAGNPPWNIPWNIPTDARHFRELTEGGVVLMGKDTYALFDAPLPNRRNVVASQKLTAVRPGFELVNDVAEFLQTSSDDIWIIGGASLYQSTLDACEELYITHIDGDFNCDRFLPDFYSKFILSKESPRQSDNGHTFRFATYINKNR
ncbi:N/A [soil metagenome]